VLTAVATTAAAIAQPHRHRGGCAYAQTPVTRANRAVIRRAVLCLINRRRRLDRLPPLRLSRQLSRSAQSWTDEMVRRKLFAHVEGASRLKARARAAGYQVGAVGEDIASGFSTPAAVVNAWIASPHHCFNILSPLYRDAGVGVAARAIGGATGGATWTEDFGSRIGSPPPSGNWGPANSCLRRRR
jgi:uncharacterized protein YkwD